MSAHLSFVEKHLSVASRSGDEVCCLCPLHGDTNPSMYVNVAKGVFCCHSCGEGGSLRALAVKMGLGGYEDPPVALEALLDRLRGLSEPPASTVQPAKPEGWLDQFDYPTPYWSSRGLSEGVISRFQLGYDVTTNEGTIPLRNHRGKLVGVIRRKLDPEARPKYRYPKGVPIGQYLFGSWLLTRGTRRKVALVEGSLDAVACWDAGVPALALLGSRLTDDQAKILVRLGISTVVVFTDNDRAGVEAVPQIKSRLNGLTTLVAYYRPYWSAKDPGELRPPQRKKAYHSAVPVHRWVQLSG